MFQIDFYHRDFCNFGTRLIGLQTIGIAKTTIALLALITRPLNIWHLIVLTADRHLLLCSTHSAPLCLRLQA